MTGIPEALVWKLVEAAIMSYQTHGNRDLVVGQVRQLEQQGLSNAEITAAIQKGRQGAEAQAQQDIDAARKG